MNPSIQPLANRYREAWQTARRVPTGDHLGHSGYWPEIIPNRWEVYRGEEKPIKRQPPPPDAVDRMIECMRWLRWLDDDERKLIWLRAADTPWRKISQQTGLPRTTAQRHWKQILAKIGVHLSVQGEEFECICG